ncbi:MAG: magnesium-translocating P-type ATPase [Patescibacteria group bacterium]|nr:magnesium-translocating P-type ATPase [Patescibacteria group bacterium]
MESLTNNFPLWTKEKSEIFKLLQTSEEGLSEKEAKRRLKVYGLNELAVRRRFDLFFEFISTFLNPLILLLIFAGLVSAFLGEATNFVIILAIIFISGVLNFYQHYQAQNEADKLKQKVLLTTAVLRGNNQKEVPFSHIAIGDIVLLSVGDIVPADCRIIHAKDFSIDESTLTGESYPEEKSAERIGEEHLELTKRKNIAFMGTHVISGEGRAVVFATGKQAEFGQLSKEIQTAKPETSFDKGLNEFGFLLMRGVLLLTLFVFLANAALKHDILNSFLFALALAVGLTPELLPVILTINLAKGAAKMAKKEVIVKYLPAIQNLGGMDILCTDKTGTLTEDKITVRSFEDINGRENQEVLQYGLLNSHFQAGFRNPLDHALLKNRGKTVFGDFEKVDEIPFDFERKRLSVVLKNKQNGRLFLVTKGSLPRTIPTMDRYREGERVEKISKDFLEKVQKKYEQFSLSGFRVVIVGIKEIEKKDSYEVEDEKDLVFLGFLTFFDPPQKGVLKTVNQLNHLGISLKILTGDNELVTKRLCEEIKLEVKGIMTGTEVDSLHPTDLKERALETTIFARLTPEQKSKIIQALKETGHTVGYLGDGINDAPPLKSSDVGISVHNGSDVARDVSDIILMKKSLSVLQEGVIEGRKTYANILKYLMMVTSSNFGNMLTVAAASLFLPFLPMLPIQILLANLLYDISQLAIPTDNVDLEAVQTPRKWDKSFIKKFILIFGPINSLMDFSTFFILLYLLHASVNLFQTGLFLENLATQILIIFSIRTHFVPFYKSRPSKIFSLSIFSIVAIGMILPNLSFFSSYFSFAKLPSSFFLFLILIILLYFLVVEKTKSWFYGRNKLLS